MTFGTWKTGRLPLMRGDTQWRPMVHVRDAARVQAVMLENDSAKANERIFNVGSAENVYRICPLGELVAESVSRDVEIEWYGDPDRRSYRVTFDKIEALGWRTERTAADSVTEICEALEAGTADKTLQTITLDWYREPARWHRIVSGVEMYGGIVEI